MVFPTRIKLPGKLPTMDEAVWSMFGHDEYKARN